MGQAGLQIGKARADDNLRLGIDGKGVFPRCLLGQRAHVFAQPIDLLSSTFPLLLEQLDDPLGAFGLGSTPQVEVFIHDRIDKQRRILRVRTGIRNSEKFRLPDLFHL